MTPLVNTDYFQCFIWPVEEGDEEAPLFSEMEKEARDAIGAMRWSPPIESMLLAYGVGGVFALYLVKYAHPIVGGECDGDWESWVGVGNGPTIVFDTPDALTPVLGMDLYCWIAEDWADSILAGRSLAECYPIAAAPTKKHAVMLKTRVAFIREKLIPQAMGYAPSNSNRA